MNLELKGHTALVTGGSKGIGADIVRVLCEEGMRVAFCARESAALRQLERESQESGYTVMALATDVRSAAGIAACVNTVLGAWGGLDLLVNNVGGAPGFGPLESLTDEQWQEAFELNVMSTVRFSRQCLPALRKSTLRRIINLSSLSAVQPGRWNPHYTSSKAAMLNFSKFLANSLAPEGILVNAVCPGPVHSDSWERNIVNSSQVQARSLDEVRNEIEQGEAAKVPLGRVGEGREIANAVAFLASPRSAWTTGSCFHIDGGKLAVSL